MADKTVPDNDDIQVGLRLSREDLTALDQLCANQGRSRPSMVRVLIREAAAPLSAGGNPCECGFNCDVNGPGYDWMLKHLRSCTLHRMAKANLTVSYERAVALAERSAAPNLTISYEPKVCVDKPSCGCAAGHNGDCETNGSRATVGGA